LDRRRVGQRNFGNSAPDIEASRAGEDVPRKTLLRLHFRLASVGEVALSSLPAPGQFAVPAGQ
jgi:hypothetical protein